MDLRITEAPVPSRQGCHASSPHSDKVLSLHAQGQVSCRVCHVRTFGKDGTTEMSRDWSVLHWNGVCCSGRGGFVGEEVKERNVMPEYVWFDGKSRIVLIKRHFSAMALHKVGRIVPLSIMWMFMTGDFDFAVQEGMEEQGMSGSYTIVDADTEMLITCGIEPKENAPSCADCHHFSGNLNVYHVSIIKKAKEGV